MDRPTEMRFQVGEKEYTRSDNTDSYYDHKISALYDTFGILDMVLVVDKFTF